MSNTVIKYDKFDEGYVNRTKEAKIVLSGDSKLSSLQYGGKYTDDEGNEKDALLPNIILNEGPEGGEFGETEQPVTTVTQNWVDVVGSVVLVDKQDRFHKVAVWYEDYNAECYPTNRYKPIGVVVCPASHMQDGAARVMSLNDMDEGEDGLGNKNNDQHAYLVWAKKASSSGSQSFEPVYHLVTPRYYGAIMNVNHNGTIDDDYEGEPFQITVDDIKNSANKHFSISACISSDIYRNNGVVNPYDNSSYYVNPNSYLAPSPFNNDGTFNKVYAKRYAYDDRDGENELREEETRNCLSDLRGDINTRYGIYKSSRTDVDTDNAYLLRICGNYRTDGTRPGDWYLPAAGEIGYVLNRLDIINDAIEKALSVYGGALYCQQLPYALPNSYSKPVEVSNDGLWSSTESAGDTVWTGECKNACLIRLLEKQNTHIARAFHKVSLSHVTDGGKRDAEYSVSVVVWPIECTCVTASGNGIYSSDDDVNIRLALTGEGEVCDWRFVYWARQKDGGEFEVITDIENEYGDGNKFDDFTFSNDGHNYVFRAMFYTDTDDECLQSSGVETNGSLDDDVDAKNILAKAAEAMLKQSNQFQGNVMSLLSRTVTLVVDPISAEGPDSVLLRKVFDTSIHTKVTVTMENHKTEEWEFVRWEMKKQGDDDYETFSPEEKGWGDDNEFIQDAGYDVIFKAVYQKKN